jgi:hypothetical protein
VLAEIERVTHNSAQSTHQRYLDIFKIVEQRALAPWSEAKLNRFSTGSTARKPC